MEENKVPEDILKTAQQKYPIEGVNIRDGIHAWCQKGYIEGAMNERALQEENMVRLLEWVVDNNKYMRVGQEKGPNVWINQDTMPIDASYEILTTKEIIALWKEYAANQKDSPAEG